MPPRTTRAEAEAEAAAAAALENASADGKGTPSEETPVENDAAAQERITELEESVEGLTSELAAAHEHIAELETDLQAAQNVGEKLAVEDTFVAKRSFAVMRGGQRVFVHIGETVPAGSWLLGAQPEAFKPFAVTHPLG